MPNVWLFPRNGLLAILTVGIATPLMDHRVSTLVFQLLFNVQGIIKLSDYLFASTGGPLLGELL
jgi:hypothetical protein